MRQLRAFNQVSLDAYYTDANGDMSWADKHDPKWASFTSSEEQSWSPTEEDPQFP